MNAVQVPFLLDRAGLQARGQDLQEILAVPSPHEYSLLPGSRRSDQGSYVDNASGQLQLCPSFGRPRLHTKAPKKKAYDPKTHSLCLHPRDSLLWSLFLPPPPPTCLSAPKGSHSHCVGEKKDAQIQLPPKWKQPFSLYTLLLRE